MGSEMCIRDRVCTAVFCLRNTAATCGLLRRWWDAPWLDLSHSHPFEQRPMNMFYRCNRAFGADVRLMPTAAFFRTKQAGWPINTFVHHMTERFRSQPDFLLRLLQEVIHAPATQSYLHRHTGYLHQIHRLPTCNAADSKMVRTQADCCLHPAQRAHIFDSATTNCDHRLLRLQVQRNHLRGKNS